MWLLGKTNQISEMLRGEAEYFSSKSTNLQ